MWPKRPVASDARQSAFAFISLQLTALPVHPLLKRYTQTAQYGNTYASIDRSWNASSSPVSRYAGIPVAAVNGHRYA